jgi:uncharacterized protein (TIGR03083 family)
MIGAIVQAGLATGRAGLCHHEAAYSSSPAKKGELSTTASLVSQADSVAADLERYLADPPPAAWAGPSDCAGWTVAQVVAHLTTAAAMFADSVERGLEGESGPPPEAVEGPAVYRVWRERLLREHAALPPAALLAALKESLPRPRRALPWVATEPPCSWLIRLAGQTAEALGGRAAAPDATIHADPGA